MTRFAYKLIFLILLIMSVGILTIYSSTFNSSSPIERSLYLRQIIWAFLGLVCLLAISRISYRQLWDGADIFYAIGIGLLLTVAISGFVRSGAQRWLKIFWFNFQPSELMKLIVVIYLARYFSQPSESLRQDVENWGIIKAIGIPFIFICPSILLILKQPDLGTAIFIFFVFIAMLFVARVNFKFILLILLGVVISSPVLWHFLKDYQKTRLLVFLKPNVDPLGAGYTIIQSKIAVASGGLFGKGWLGGSQSQLHFLPESHTDFIFATFAEQWGLMGSLVLLLLYYLLLRLGLNVTQRASDYFGHLLASGITLNLGISIFINVAMIIGLAPVVGLPLPLLSYGGSSLVVTLFSLGILLNIEKRLAI